VAALSDKNEVIIPEALLALEGEVLEKEVVVSYALTVLGFFKASLTKYEAIESLLIRQLIQLLQGELPVQKLLTLHEPHS